VTEESDNLELPDDESITQVGEPAKKPIPIWLIVFVMIAAIGIILFSMSDKDEKKDNDIDFTGDEYSVSNTPAPNKISHEIPKALVQPKEIHTIDLTPELSAEEKQRLRKEEDMRDRRRRSPLVLVNKGIQPGTGAKNEQAGQISNLRMTAREKMDRLERETRKALSAYGTGGQGEDGKLGDLSTSSVEMVTAGYVKDRAFKLLQGKVIPAVLETAMNSDLPGMVRSIVSEPVYSEDGNYLLIAKGSRLVGEYRNNIELGQERIFVIWSRLLTPDGMDIKLDSPGTDSLGRAGVSGFIDSHFLERFGASALLSIIGGFSQSGTDNDNQRIAVSDSFSKSAEIALENSINIPPTMHKNQGDRINVFVARDLNFKPAVLYARKLERQKK